jgi:hypothetical protein
MLDTRNGAYPMSQTRVTYQPYKHHVVGCCSYCHPCTSASFYVSPIHCPASASFSFLNNVHRTPILHRDQILARFSTVTTFSGHQCQPEKATSLPLSPALTISRVCGNSFTPFPVDARVIVQHEKLALMFSRMGHRLRKRSKLCGELSLLSVANSSARERIDLMCSDHSSWTLQKNTLVPKP